MEFWGFALCFASIGANVWLFRRMDLYAKAYSRLARQYSKLESTLNKIVKTTDEVNRNTFNPDEKVIKVM